MVDSLESALNASLADLIDGETFREVCASYYTLFEVPVRVFDKDGTLVAEAVHTQRPCHLLNKHNEGRRICNSTRLEVKGDLPRADEISFVDCICALRYAVIAVPFQGQVLGKLVLGPYLPAGVERLPAAAAASVPGLDEDALKEALSGMRHISETAVRRISAAMLAVIDVILFSAHKALVTSQMHIASIRESYRALTDKNKDLEEMNEKMREFERIKASFLSTVSHELRTPLTSIIGYSEMLAEGFAGELAAEQRQFILTIKSKGDELLKLITSILDFSEIESGHLDLHLEETDPGELVQRVVKDKRDLADRRGVRLVVNVTEELPRVSLDPEKVLAALSHLIDNAIKFSPPGGLVVVSAAVAGADSDSGERPEEEDFGFVLMASPDLLDLTVQDYGVGIAENDQSRIFAPFTQIDDSSTREHGGAGLGLAVVKHYIEAHGGRVIVTSRPEEGSTFTLRIPIVGG